MDRYLSEFEDYLNRVKSLAPSSMAAYRRDVKEFGEFLAQRGLIDLKDLRNPDLVAYLLNLKHQGRSGATMNRKAASLRALGGFLQSRGYLEVNPAASIKTPKVEKKKVIYLTVQEMETLLSLPDGSIKGMRDRAILEILYATGIRVTEVVELNLADVNLRIGFISCTGEHGKARIIPLGRPAKVALEEYIYGSRPELFQRIGRDHKEEEALFVNVTGDRLSRQGLWKLMKGYAAKAGIDTPITPQTLRHSFAVHMLQNGADLRSLQELLGHEDLTTTQAYLEVTKARIKEVYDNSHPRA